MPKAEQPYLLPENWRWVKLKSIYTINPKIIANDDIEAAFIPMEKISAGTDSSFEFEIQPWGKAKKGHTQFGDGDVAFAKISPCFENRKSMIISGLPNGIGGGTTELIILRQPTMNQHFTYWLVSTDGFIQGGCKTYSGTVGQQRISMEYVKEYPVPLPPLVEQQRIVDRIESLFAKLDEAKEKAQAVVDAFEDRKAAILHKAFSGELTAEWRKTNDVSRNDWDKVTLSDVCKVNPSKVDVKSLPDDLEVSFFPMPALSEIYGTITEPQTRPLGEVRTGFTNFSEGDVVFAKITPCMENGKSAVIGQLVNGIGFGTTEFFVLRCSDRLFNRYLWHLVRDRFFRNEAKAVMTGAVGQQRVPKSFLENYPIALPSVEEQIEIVRILDNSFEKELQVKEAAEQVIDQIDTMKKSILARAFHGELGTNDPADESAEELLKRII